MSSRRRQSPRPAAPPTMRDVARLAEVSTMTVSRVLRDPGRVTTATRARVEWAIGELCYVPNRVAGSLSSQRTGFVAAVLPTLHNANFAQTAQGLSEVLRGAGFQLLVGYTDYRIGEEESLVRAMLARRPEGLVVAGGHHTEPAAQLLGLAGIPVLEIWDLPAEPIGYAVGFSNRALGRAMTERLITLGYRRIAFLAPPRTDGFRDFRGEDRLLGYLDAMAAAGLPDDLVFRAGQGPVSFDHGARGIAHLCENGVEVEAVFAVSDMSAVGAMAECQRRGIDIPGDIAIAGFGNFEIGALMHPRLTTVGVDCMEIGRLAARTIIRLVEGGEGRAPVPRPIPRSVDLGFRIIERESSPSTGNRGA